MRVARRRMLRLVNREAACSVVSGATAVVWTAEVVWTGREFAHADQYRGTSLIRNSPPPP